MVRRSSPCPANPTAPTALTYPAATRTHHPDADGPTRSLGPDGLGTPSTDSAPPAAGRFFGDYELLEEVARGGMGVVYRARQLSLSRIVALKMIIKGELATPQELARFRLEAEAAARLDHPNIVPIYEVGEHDGYPYFTMRFIEGGSLAETRQPVRDVADNRRAAELVLAVARAVHCAHQHGIIHRDLKPANILLTAVSTSGPVSPSAPTVTISPNHLTPFVTDFGIAKRIDAATLATVSGAILGTPNFMAPEQARGDRHLTTAVDVYALGAVLYDLLAGKPPFGGSTVYDILKRVLEQEPVDPRTINPAVDRDLSVIALKCLEKEPGRRYSSAEQVADELDRWMRGETIQARPVGRAGRMVRWVRRNPALATTYALTALAVTLGGLGGAAVWQWRNAEAAREDASVARERVELANADLDAKNRQTELALAGEKKAKGETQGALDREKAARAAEVQARDELRRVSYLRDVDLAYRECLTGNVGRARNLLDGCPEDLRNWEWHHTRRLYQSERFTLGNSRETVGAVAFSLDGRLAAVAEMSGLVRVWDAKTGQFVRTLQGLDDSVQHVAFNADGSRLAALRTDSWVAKTDHRVMVWDVASGEVIHNISVHHEGVSIRVAFSPDGKYVATGGGDKSLARMWSLETGQLVHTFDWHTAPVGALAFSPDGQFLATGGSDGRVRVWDVTTGKPTHTPEKFAPGVYALQFSLDGKRLAVGLGNATAAILPLAGGGQPVVVGGHGAPVYSVTFSPDGTLLATTDWFGTSFVWQSANGRLWMIPSSRGNRGGSVVFGPDGGWLVTASQGVAEVWNTRTRLHESSLVGHTGRIDAWVIARSGAILTGGSDGDVKLWDRETAVRRILLVGFREKIRSLAVSPDGSRFVTGDDAKRVILWDARTGSKVRELGLLDGWVTGVAFTADGREVVATATGGSVRGWDVESGKPSPNWQFQLVLVGGADKAAIAPEKRLVAVRSGNAEVTVWAIPEKAGEKPRLVRKITVPGFVSSIAFSPDGSRLVVGGNGTVGGIIRAGEVRVWDVGTEREWVAVDAEDSNNRAVAISSDGTRVFTFRNDGLRVWDTPTRHEVLSLHIPGSLFHDPVAISADGKQIFAVMDSSTVVVWDAAPRVRPTLPTEIAPPPRVANRP